jgi:hypothetical protein
LSHLYRAGDAGQSGRHHEFRRKIHLIYFTVVPLDYGYVLALQLLHLSCRADTILSRHNPGADHAGVERLSARPRHAPKSQPVRNRLVGRGRRWANQNQPPDGTRPLRRRYVTRLP